MSRIGRIIAFLMVASLRLQAQCTLDKSHWTLVFNEEFDEDNVTALLAHGWVLGETDPGVVNMKNNVSHQHIANSLFPAGHPRAGLPKTYYCADSSKIRLKDGLAYFKAQSVSCTCDSASVGKAGFLTCNRNELGPGICDYAPGYMYGMFEIRCKLPGTKGQPLCPAFWSSSAMGAPEHDIFEYHPGDDYFISTTHYQPFRDSSHEWGNQFFFHTRPLYNDFHTWTLVWTPEKVTYFFDGKELKTADTTGFFKHIIGGYEQINDPAVSNPSDSGAFMKNCLRLRVGNQLALANENPDEKGAPEFDSLIVDYVRVYKPNTLPNYFAPPFAGINTNEGLHQYYDSLLACYRATPYKSSADWVFDAVISTPYEHDEDAAYPKSGLRCLQGGNKFIYRGRYGLLWTTYGGAKGWESTPVDTRHPVDADIALSNNGERTFYRNGRQIWDVYKGVYTRIAGIDDAVSDLIPAPGGDALYYRNTLDQIVYADHDGSGSWKIATLTPVASTSGWFAIDPNDFGVLYAATSSNNIGVLVNGLIPGHVAREFAALTATNDVDGFITVSGNSNDVFYKTNKATLRVISRSAPGVAFSAPADFYAWYDNAAVKAVVNNISADFIIGNDPANPQYYFVGSDRRIWLIYPGSKGFHCAPMQDDYNHADISCCLSPILLGQNTGTVHLCYVGTDNRIRTVEWRSPCENLNPTPSPAIELTKGSLPGAFNPAYIFVYPNPASSIVSVNLVNFQSPVVDIAIKGIDGRGIISLKDLKNTGTLSIDVSKLNPGMYIITVADASTIKSAKIYKQ